MQLGTRFSVGSPVPGSLPAPVTEALVVVESGLSEADGQMLRWTLTWLEGNPVLELDDGTVIRYSGGHAQIDAPND